MTLSLLALPVIIISAQGALQAVSDSIRQGAYALGARTHQVVLGQVVPAALPGIMTGLILAFSRIVGGKLASYYCRGFGVYGFCAREYV